MDFLNSSINKPLFVPIDRLSCFTVKIAHIFSAFRFVSVQHLHCLNYLVISLYSNTICHLFEHSSFEIYTMILLYRISVIYLVTYRLLNDTLDLRLRKSFIFHTGCPNEFSSVMSSLVKILL